MSKGYSFSQIMKKAIGLLGVLALLPLFLVLANDHELEKRVNWKVSSVPAGRMIDRDFFAYGESVEISGTVNGDVYAVGGHILVDGTINGDLLAAGGKIMISGDILQDARMAGGRITVGGNIGRNLTVAGGQVEVGKTGRVQGGLVAAGGDLDIAGPVGRDIVVVAGNVMVSNKIGGRASVAAPRIRLTSQAEVEGDFRYWSTNSPSIDKQATVVGSVIQRKFPRMGLPSTEEMLAVWSGIKIVFTLASFTSTLVLGLFLIHFYPKFVQRAISHIRQEPLASMGLGFVVLVGTPVLVGLLGMTLLGIPLALFLTVVFLLYLYLGRIFVIAWVGQAMFERFGKGDSQKWAFTSGLVLYSLLTLVPFVGGAIALFVMVCGLGTILLAKKEVDGEARRHGLI